MKRTGRHPEKDLSQARIRSLKEPGRYADGNGLYLVVEPSGAKRWVLRTVVQGRRRDIGLGGLTLVSLAEAREKALTYRKLAREGEDPLALRRKARTVVPTFAQAAERVYEEHRASWKNPRHAQQWINTLQQYAVPVIGDRRVDEIDTPEILKVLGPIWLTKQVTARRVRQRIGTVLDWAKAAGFRSGENPINGLKRGLPKQSARDEHLAALPYTQVPRFMDLLRASSGSGVARLAFEFLILTAARTSEVLLATWSEIDLPTRVWTVPAERMKAGREHRVPLSDRTVEILLRARELSPTSPYVFPGASGRKPFSNMVFLRMLRHMKIDATVHGFRSAFRDWAAEQTSAPREVAEAALAHTNKDKVEAAYRRSDLFDPRRNLMTQWAQFLQAAEERPGTARTRE
jgi:integrase